MKYLKYIISGLLIIPIRTLYPFINSAAISNCNDVIFVFARGSGESLDGSNYQEFKTKIEENLSGSSLKYTFYELGSSMRNSHQYPATPIGIDTVSNIITTVGAKISAGESYKFGDSVKEGIEELSAYISSINSTCTETKFVIAGYSQGGLVVSKSINSIDSSKIIYAATLGDPKLYLPEGYGDNPDACHGKNLSDYRTYVPDCRAYEGILGQNNPYQPEDYYNKLGAWCNYLDIMCSKHIYIPNPIKGHTSYVQDGLYEKLAKVINNKLSETYPEKITKTEVNLSTHDVAILIDSTGSMSSLIDKYKSEALRLAKEAIDMGGRIALYEYRDLKDPFEPVQHCNFETCTLSIFEEELNSIKTSGGGDALESAMSASLKVLDTEKWKVGATKTIVLLTDSGYHPVDLDKVTFHQVVRRSLEIDPVNFYIITTPNTIKNYTELAEATGGKVFSSIGELNLSTTQIIERPTVLLQNSEYYGIIGDEILFNARSSYSTSKIISYEWDLDCDGIFETTSTDPIITKIYNSAIEGFVQIKVTDENGLFSTMTAKLIIQDKTQETNTALKIIGSLEEGRSVAINYSASNDEKVFLVLNDALLGELTEKQFTIDNLNLNINNEISLISYNNVGEKRETQSLIIKRKSKEKHAIKAPDSGIVKTTWSLSANDRQTHIYKRQDF